LHYTDVYIELLTTPYSRIETNNLIKSGVLRRWSVVHHSDHSRAGSVGRLVGVDRFCGT
jgi:hypothetical protein